MVSEAKRAGNARHVAKLDLIKIQPYKEEGAAIRAAALAANQSVQGYVLQAVRERMEREGAAIAGSSPKEPQTAPEGGDCDVVMSGTGTARRQAQNRFEQPRAGAADGVDTPGWIPYLPTRAKTP